MPLSSETRFSDRFHPEAPRARESRSETRRDRDRILYSSCFKRLADVTQVVAANNAHVFHNRLTHSLQVAQVGRSIAERLLGDPPQRSLTRELGGLDADAVEAACLAHDLGHPPFGHTSEEELNRLAAKHGLRDGFEGNPQSFRVLNRLAFRSPDYPGLNLTRATLAGILKYPWPRAKSGQRSKKWGAYLSEAEELAWAREPLSAGDTRRTPEAEIMDWADDVTYSVHDVEDFYRAGLIPLHLLSARTDERERKKFLDDLFRRRRADPGVWQRYSRADLENAFIRRVILFDIDRPYSGDREDRSKLRRFSGRCIDDFVHAIRLRKPRGRSGSCVEIDPGREKEVAVLKELTWHYVINDPSTAAQQEGQRRVIRGLFECFREAARRGRFSVFPVFHQELLRGASPREATRVVVDLISGMTERQATAMYQRLAGASLPVGFDRILE
jgi:dGTPase